MPKPTPAALDLDELERDGDHPEPLTVTLNGRQWTLADPVTVDWQQVLDMDVNDPRSVLAAYLGDDFPAFAKLAVPMWKIEKLLEAIDRHYSPPGVDQGEGDAS